MRVGEPDRPIQPLGEPLMAGHLAAPVVGQALAQDRRQAPHRPVEAFQGRLGGAIAHLAQHDIAGLALDERADRGAVVGALDQVAFPVVGHQALLDLLGPMGDA